jgi:hypothetical protein
MTEEPKSAQKPWYPTIEREPLLYNVETGPNLGDDNPMLLEDAEGGENGSVAGDQLVRETARSTGPIKPTKPAKE